MKFLLDNNLSPRLARALDELSDHHIVALRDRFPIDIPDETWIRNLAGEGGWHVVSLDRAVIRSRAARVELQKSGLTVFFLQAGWASLDYWTKAVKLTKAWPTIEAQARNVKTGVSYLVPVSGKLVVVP